MQAIAGDNCTTTVVGREVPIIQAFSNVEWFFVKNMKLMIYSGKSVYEGKVDGRKRGGR